jgi:two-component system, OmpR family, phosphate regulon response regulator PhoB
VIDRWRDIPLQEPSVLVVEDDEPIRELLELVLRSAGFDVWLAASAEAAIDRLRGAIAPIAIVDWSLPGMAGPALVKKLRQDERTASMSLVMLTARGSEQDRVHGLEAGADDYIVKPFSTRELVARIRALVRRRAPELADEPIEIGSLRLDPRAHTVTFGQRRLALRLVEFKLLRFLMAWPDRVFTRTELLDHVWGEQVYVDDRTVDVHVRRLRIALGEDHRDLVATVRSGGYKLDSSHERGKTGIAT